MDYYEEMHAAQEIAAEALASIEYLTVVEYLDEEYPELVDGELESAADSILRMAQGLRLSR